MNFISGATAATAAERESRLSQQYLFLSFSVSAVAAVAIHEYSFGVPDLRQAGDDLVHTLRRHLLMVIKINLQTGREIAIPQALDLHQRELAVRRGIADSAAEFVFDPLGDRFRAPEPAGERPADLQFVFADGLARIHGVEGH